MSLRFLLLVGGVLTLCPSLSLAQCQAGGQGNAGTTALATGSQAGALRQLPVQQRQLLTQGTGQRQLQQQAARQLLAARQQAIVQAIQAQATQLSNTQLLQAIQSGNVYVRQAAVRELVTRQAQSASGASTGP
jgi:hypothetical protein